MRERRKREMREIRKMREEGDPGDLRRRITSKLKVSFRSASFTIKISMNIHFIIKRKKRNLADDLEANLFKGDIQQ